jgi:hypothetical protein
MRELIIQARAAAAQIDNAQARRIAAREADRIPLTAQERAHGRKGEVAKLARAHMRRLPDMPREEYPNAISVLRNCADALDSRFEVISETRLGGKTVRHREQYIA